LLHKSDDLVARARRLNEVRALFIEREQTLLECAHLEKVILLLQQFERLRMNRTHLFARERALAVEDLALGLKLLTPHAVERFELTCIDMALVVQLLQERRYALFVTFIRGANEVVVR